MEKTHYQLPPVQEERHPFLSIILITLFSFGFLALANGLGLVLVQKLFHMSMDDIAILLSAPQDVPQGRWALYLIQGLSALAAFILAPAFYIYFFQKAPVNAYFGAGLADVKSYGLMALLVFTVMVVNATIIEWNQSLSFPEPFDSWARGQESKLEELTKYITTIESPVMLLAALVIIGVLPALGEEFLFRGLIQNRFMAWTSNHHTAIWVTAILFSAFHMQFFGFFPRLLLGALFGYLYVWSGSLWIPIVAHFINNSFTLMALYFYQTGQSGLDIESAEGPPWYISLIFLVFSGLLLYLFRKYHRVRSSGLE